MNKSITWMALALVATLLGCKKQVTEPEHLTSGRNVVYIKVDNDAILLRQSFTLKAGDIRSDISGANGSGNASFASTPLGVKPAGVVAFECKPSSEKKQKCFRYGTFQFGFFEDASLPVGLPFDLRMVLPSSKYGREISIFESGNYEILERKPTIKIEGHDSNARKISGTVAGNYKETGVQGAEGQYYIYFDLTY